MLNWLEMKEIMVCNQGGVMKELSALVYHVINVPGAAAATRQPARLPEVTPAGVASLLLGASLALMLCGSVTFVIGFILMPWVLGLLAVFHLLGLLSHLSLLGKHFFASAASAPPPSPSPISDELLSKLPFYKFSSGSSSWQVNPFIRWLRRC